MPDIYKIKADLPNLRCVVKFRNNDNPCVVIASNKATADAKNFREAAGFLQSNESQRAKDLAGWLVSRAVEFEMCESGNGNG